MVTEGSCLLSDKLRNAQRVAKADAVIGVSVMLVL